MIVWLRRCGVSARVFTVSIFVGGMFIVILQRHDIKNIMDNPPLFYKGNDIIDRNRTTADKQSVNVDTTRSSSKKKKNIVYGTDFPHAPMEFTKKNNSVVYFSRNKVFRQTDKSGKKQLTDDDNLKNISPRNIKNNNYLRNENSKDDIVNKNAKLNDTNKAHENTNTSKTQVSWEIETYHENKRTNNDDTISFSKIKKQNTFGMRLEDSPRIVIRYNKYKRKNPKDNMKEPHYVIILKSPRSGSTFLYECLKENQRVDVLFEPPISIARSHFISCSKRVGIVERVCVIMLNDFLHKTRYTAIMGLVEDFNATVFIQLRANVIDKALSAHKMFHSQQKITDEEFATKIRQMALSGLKTIQGFVNADKFFSRPPMWIWYEDLIRKCQVSFTKLYKEIGMPPFIPKRCSNAKFRTDPYPLFLINVLEKVPVLAPMIDHVKFNMDVDPQKIYTKYQMKTANITEVLMPFWRL